MSEDKYRKMFKNNKNIKYIEYGTFRPCFWNTPYNPNKFIKEGHLIICKPDTVVVKCKDLPLLKYYDRDMKLHFIDTTRGMFKDCIRLTRIGKETDKHRIWNLEHVYDMSDMFSNCFRLKNIFIKFKVHNVISMSGMFNKCYSLEYLNTSLWDTINTLDMSSTFRYCKLINVNGNSHISRRNKNKCNRRNDLVAEYILIIAMAILFLLIAFSVLI